MTVHATVNGQGTSTRYHFEYGPTASYGSSVPVPDEAIGTGAVEVSRTISEIEGTYHYRVVATNEEGTTYSPDQQVYVQERPTISEAEVHSHIGGGATVTASINPHGKESTYILEYGPTAAYGSKTSVKSAGAGTVAVPVSAELPAAEVGGGDVHVRYVAENWAGASGRAGTSGTRPAWAATRSKSRRAGRPWKRASPTSPA